MPFMDDKGRLVRGAYEDTNSLAEKAADVLAAHQRGDSQSTADALAHVLGHTPNFLAAAANPREGFDDFDKLAIATAALHLARKDEVRAGELVQGALGILDTILGQPRKEGAVTLTDRADVLGAYAAGLEMHERLLQAPYARSSYEMGSARFAEMLAAQQAGKMAAIAKAKDAALGKEDVVAPAVHPAATEAAQPAAPSRAKVIKGEHGERDFLAPRFLKQGGHIWRSLREADAASSALLEAKDFEGARKVFEDYMHRQGQLMHEPMYLRYLEALLHTGNPRAVVFIMGPHMGKGSRLHDNAKAAELFAQARAAHHSGPSAPARPAGDSQAARLKGGTPTAEADGN